MWCVFIFKTQPNPQKNGAARIQRYRISIVSKTIAVLAFPNNYAYFAAGKPRLRLLPTVGFENSIFRKRQTHWPLTYNLKNRKPNDSRISPNHSQHLFRRAPYHFVRDQPGRDHEHVFYGGQKLAVVSGSLQHGGYGHFGGHVHFGAGRGGRFAIFVFPVHPGQCGGLCCGGHGADARVLPAQPGFHLHVFAAAAGVLVIQVGGGGVSGFAHHRGGVPAVSDGFGAANRAVRCVGRSV